MSKRHRHSNKKATQSDESCSCSPKKTSIALLKTATTQPPSLSEKAIYCRACDAAYRVYNKTGLCLYSSISSCNKQAIKSHSISRATLQMIARDNHVLAFDRLYFDDFASVILFKNQPQKVGINNASVFLGFCDTDDSSIFAPIEKQNTIRPTKEQLLLFHFRAVAYFYWDTGRSSAVLSAGLNAMAAETRNFGEWTASDLKHAANIQILFLSSLETYFDRLKGDVALGNGSPYKSLFIRLNKIPEVFCCVLGFPVFDFDGRPLVPFNTNNFPLSVVISADNQGGYIALSWDRESTYIDIFIDSWAQRGYDFNCLLSFIFSCDHNYYFSPEWWDSLSDEKKKRLTAFSSLPYFAKIDAHSFISGAYRLFTDSKFDFSSARVLTDHIHNM